MKKITALLLITVLTSACSNFKPKVGAPWMQKLITQGPDGPTNFKLGWIDGCETGISSSANRFQRQFYRFKQNYELSQDPVYYTGWRAAYNYCQRYTFQYLRRDLI